MERTLKLGTAYHGNRFLHQVDADAFMTLGNVNEVFGQGFKPHGS